jgi:Zn-dependent M28 family amino/carboxypeptidase
MKSAATLASVALALPAAVNAAKCKKFVTSEALQADIKLSTLVAGSYRLQNFADANGGNRAFGSAGHNATVDWLASQLEATGFYDVQKQPFTEIFSAGTGTVIIDGETIDSQIMTYTPSGVVVGTLTAIANNGCEATDYPEAAENTVAFVSRGTCAFSQKAIQAKAAGYAAAVVYNNEPGVVAGTLGELADNYASIVGISQADGQAILEKLQAGEVAVDYNVDSIAEERVNFNVIAETKTGDHDNVLVLGGHSDSVAAGPGINDDGSGTIGVYAVAKALTNYKIKNAVRFAFWGAEEFGKLGSIYYVQSLNSSAAEVAKMRAYLNFDMIASPNYVYGIYDGDGNAFNISGPSGSDVIEKDFEDFYASKYENSVPSAFTGRSDYLPFIENGIPSGGLFTGAEVVKTDEEERLFGGEAGVAYDVNYHKAGDDIDNLNLDAYLLNTKAIANSVAKYAMSWETIPSVDVTKRSWNAEQADLVRRSGAGNHGHSGHGHAGACGGGDLM